MKKALILSDGRPGHFNQSIALCKHLGIDYEITEIAYKTRQAKAISYLLDRAKIYTEALFKNFNSPATTVDLIISTGSTTYYANKLVARKLKCPNIAILNPKGYRLDFSHIFCPAYDHPPKQKNITELPLNLCAAEPAFFAAQATEFSTKHTQQKPAIGIVIGGSNAISEINPKSLRNQLQQIFALSEGQERWITTSPRTPKAIEAIIEEFSFDYMLINSRESYNPIPAFIQQCDRLFVTSDSASMISECASFGTANVEILMNRQLKSPNKFEKLIQGLSELHAVHIFDGTLGDCAKKLDLKKTLLSATTLIQQ